MPETLGSVIRAIGCISFCCGLSAVCSCSESVTTAAFDLGIAPMFWDNGEELDRVSYQWRTAGLMDALERATSGQDYGIVKQP